MDKQTIITLLRKDIAELMQLTEGFDQIAQCPPVLIQLALQKTNSVQQILNELLTLPKTVETVEKATENEATQLTKPVEETIAVQNTQIITEQSNTNEKATVDIPEEVQIKEQNLPEQNEQLPVEKEEKELKMDENVLTVETQSEVVDVEIEEPFEKEEEKEIVEDTLNESPEEVEEVEEVEEEIEEQEELEVEEDNDDEEELEDEEDKVAVNEERIELIAKPEIMTRNDSIVNSKIEDISKAISLGDRFLFQRELFGNNGEIMQKTIAHLNSMNSAEEAMTYLQKKFAWDKESTTVERFIQLISRRYL